jgi:acetyl esterase/lipase
MTEQEQEQMSMLLSSPEAIRSLFMKGDIQRDADNKEPAEVDTIANISYGPYGAANLMDIYFRKDMPGRNPTIINVHGGGWVTGGRWNYKWYCMDMAKRGFTVINAELRLAPENKFPCMPEDVNNILTWIESQGTLYHMDPDNLFLCGDSAGAQVGSQYLTMLTNPDYAKLFAFSVPNVKIRACAMNCGVYDLYSAYESGDKTLGYYLKDSGIRNPEELKVVEHVTNKFPPAFIMTCEGDFLKANADPFYKSLKDLGVETELRIYGDKENPLGHVFHLNMQSEEGRKLNDEESEFFKKHILKI